MTERIGTMSGGMRFWITSKQGEMCGGHFVSLDGRVGSLRYNFHRSHFKRIEDAQRQGDFFVEVA